jgi:hypothetical protein
MGAMRRAKGVVDVNIAVLGQLLGEGAVVGFFFGMEAQVLQQNDFAAAQFRDTGIGSSPTQSLVVATGWPSSSCKAARTGVRRIASTTFALGAPKCAIKTTVASVIEQVTQGGQSFADARVVCDLSGFFVEGNVVIDAHQATLAAHINVLNCLFIHGSPRFDV